MHRSNRRRNSRRRSKAGWAAQSLTREFCADNVPGPIYFHCQLTGQVLKLKPLIDKTKSWKLERDWWLTLNKSVFTFWLLGVWLCCWYQNVRAQYQCVCSRVNICCKNSLNDSLILNPLIPSCPLYKRKHLSSLLTDFVKQNWLAKRDSWKKTKNVNC